MKYLVRIGLLLCAATGTFACSGGETSSEETQTQPQAASQPSALPPPKASPSEMDLASANRQWLACVTHPDPNSVMFDADAARVVAKELASTSNPPLKELRRQLFHKDEYLQTGALLTIGQVGHPAESAIPDIEKLMGDPYWKTQSLPIEVLGELGPVASRSLPLLLRLLRTSTDMDLRTATYQALPKFSNDYDKVVPALVKALKLEDPQYAASQGRGNLIMEVIYALAAVGEPAVPPLISALDSRDAVVRNYSANSLAEMGENGSDYSKQAAKAALPALSRHVNDPNRKVRDAVEEAISILSAS